MGDYPPQGVGKGLKNIAFGVLPTITTAFDTNPTNLSLITDDVWNNSSGIGTSALRGAFSNYGEIMIDLGAVYTVLVAGKVGMWANTFDQTYLFMRFSDDNISYGRDGLNLAEVFSVAEDIRAFVNYTARGRYFRFQLSSNANNTPNIKFYEIQMYLIA